jgi:hypothetical protein
MPLLSLLPFTQHVRAGGGVKSAAAPPAAATRAATVRGAVFDSVATRPLSGALVQLVSADNQSDFSATMLSDSAGEYAFERVPDGRYTLGFFHAMLDSLGLEPIAREVRVTGQAAPYTELAIPSPATLRRAICEARGAQSGSALVTGVVRDARSGNPLGGAKVAGEWVELSFAKGGLSRRTVRREATSSENGWYALCGVPAPGSMLLFAKRERDSTAYVEVEVPDTGFLRQELSVGAGSGPLRGTAVSAATGQPLPGAQVTIERGPTARADAKGAFAIADAPLGTRTLEVRAVGYYPERRTVNVAEGTAPVRVAMQTYQSVIDTLKVIANYDRFSRIEEFKARSRSGLGQFLTAEDIARRRALYTSELFPVVPGLFLEGYGSEQTLTMRGLTEERCVPFVYLNGSLMQGLRPADIDLLVRPEQIIGIEVYRESQAPAPFVPPLGGCGSIVFWTR